MKLLPLSQTPFVPPTDRDMLPSERREFVRTHRTCLFGFARKADGPAMSVVTMDRCTTIPHRRQPATI